MHLQLQIPCAIQEALCRWSQAAAWHVRARGVFGASQLMYMSTHDVLGVCLVTPNTRTLVCRLKAAPALALLHTTAWLHGLTATRRHRILRISLPVWPCGIRQAWLQLCKGSSAASPWQPAHGHPQQLLLLVRTFKHAATLVYRNSAPVSLFSASWALFVF
jgi:hypothetical protein